MIFDTIYRFYTQLFFSGDSVSEFWSQWYLSLWDPLNDGYFVVEWADYISAFATIVTIICGIFALFRILGGILRLFKV